ncbi:HD domain-containing phosphohydrolase [uncultured Gimesia sp.]|uniref:HD-GYP domain-containing protein n=1 Tax=uncultured Gimesia sp. TaxID=1678688 RepID=UPI00262B64A4|nr:HD domain-containing phosphohydrolase [uncultured Gimesia sp.]
MVAKSVKKKTNQYSSLDINRLCMGVKLQAPIYDGGRENNILLLASGKTITKGTIENLKKRGISSVRVHERDLANLTNDNSAKQRSPRTENTENTRVDNYRKDSQLKPVSSAAQKHDADKERTDSPWQIQTSSFLHQIKPVQAISYSPGMKTEYKKQFAGLTKATDSLYSQLLLSANVSMPQITDITNISFSQMVQDMDLFVLEGIAPIDSGNFCRHGLQMSSLAMAIGTQLGLSRENLVHLSIGCLLHDTGMSRINYKAVKGNEPLTPIDYMELKKHPIITYDLLNKIHEIPMVSKIIAYQIHERCDGSGYPRKQKSNQIHPFSKIAAVADEYLDQVSTRPGKMELHPYFAAEKLIYGASQGKFDSNSVRALLQSISLYPLGSLVELSNGQLATVIRTNRSQYDKPIVEVQSADGLNQLRNLLDDNIHVIRTISEEETQPA